MVGDRGLCSHFGADRFACLIERPRSYEDAWFLEAGTQINAFSSTKNVVMKWGIYPVEDRGISVEQMCDRALLAARGIKGRYGTHFAAYDDELRSKLLREQAITDGMEAALSGEQFEIYLQPKYRVRDDTLAGAEALVRWNHPEWGLLPPSEFIPLFEKNGFITRVDQYVWESVCAAMQAWDQKGLPPVSVSVNVSRADIYNADLPGILTETVERYGQPPSRLHLEITESAYTENPDQIIETVGRLRKLGFVVEMDDFGRGYSSLNMLNQMPLDVLKLDMKFIQSETAKPLHQGVLRFIMGLARSMNLSVVAEGVETREQLERLREIGCDYVQGYYFAKPLPCRDFEALLQGEAPAPGLEADRERDPGWLPSRALLVVDEDAGYHETVRAAFGDIYQVVEADGAAAALDCLSRHAHKLAAVVLSLSLPRLRRVRRARGVQNGNGRCGISRSLLRVLPTRSWRSGHWSPAPPTMPPSPIPARALPNGWHMPSGSPPRGNGSVCCGTRRTAIFSPACSTGAASIMRLIRCAKRICLWHSFCSIWTT